LVNSWSKGILARYKK